MDRIKELEKRIEEKIKTFALLQAINENMATSTLIELRQRTGQNTGDKTMNTRTKIVVIHQDIDETVKALATAAADFGGWSKIEIVALNDFNGEVLDRLGGLLNEGQIVCPIRQTSENDEHQGYYRL